MSCPEKNIGDCRPRTVPLQVKKSDIFRATLADDCGNLGFIGIAPDASVYHVVVPVDLQLARGVKALNQPDDGTPFGGYRSWHYYECAPYTKDKNGSKRREQIETNARLLTLWMQQFGLKITIID
jgi:hypothetical protein